jgi:ketosteroid isomerase-like protein
MGEQQMKNIIAAALSAVVILGLVFGNPPKAPPASPSVAETLKQLEQDWGDATKAVDTDKVNQILAGDWRGVGYAGKVWSKESILSDLQFGNSKLESFEFGPMDVKVLGNVAVVQGSITEKRKDDGQVGTIKAAWMDVFEKRGDKWVVVRSQSAKLN